MVRHTNHIFGTLMRLVSTKLKGNAIIMTSNAAGPEEMVNTKRVLSDSVKKRLDQQIYIYGINTS
jgi:hypothetical protein